MTLAQFHRLKLWHERHRREHPLEKNLWEAVVTLWLMGWVGAPTAFLVHAAWALVVCAAFFFLPGAYVAIRRRLHYARILRCDWISALR